MIAVIWRRACVPPLERLFMRVAFYVINWMYVQLIGELFHDESEDEQRI